MPWERVWQELFGRRARPTVTALAVGIVLSVIAGSRIVGVPYPPINVTAFWLVVGAIAAIYSGYVHAGVGTSAIVTALILFGSDGAGPIGAAMLLLVSVFTGSFAFVAYMPAALVASVIGHGLGEFLAVRRSGTPPSTLGRILVGGAPPIRPFVAHLAMVGAVTIAVAGGWVQVRSFATTTGFAVAVIVGSLPFWVAATGGGLVVSILLVAAPAVVDMAVTLVSSPVRNTAVVGNVIVVLPALALVATAIFVAGRLTGTALRWVRRGDATVQRQSLGVVRGRIGRRLHRVPRGSLKRFAVATLLVFVLFFVPSTPLLEPRPPSDLDDVSVTYQTQRCFGSCPNYSITICGNGTVHYYGRMFTETTGYERYEISEERVRSLVETAHRTDFFRLREEYSSRKSEPWTRTLTVRIGDREHSVTETHSGAPARLDELRREISAIAGDRNEKRVNERRRDPPSVDTRRCR